MHIRRQLLMLFFFVSFASATDYKIETVVVGLAFPWSIAFLPDGDMLVTEREGRLRRISHGQLEPDPIAGVPEVFVAGQGGLMEILLDPKFSSNNKIYLSFSSGTKKANALRVISGELQGNKLLSVSEIFAVTPDKDTPHHYGARMDFLPDGTLLIATGEGFDYREKAQSLDNLFGKVVRINSDSTVPDDNPFVGREGAKPEIWSYGHRNPQGLIVSDDGTVWLHEHGPRGGDELNKVRAAKNYGWPAITYGVNYSGAYVSPYTEAAGMEQPVIYWTPSIAPSGLTEYRGELFPDWHGNLFVAALAEKSVRRLLMTNGKVDNQQIMFTELDQRIRDVRAGPDGALYLLTDSQEGAVLRVSPK